MLTSPEKYACRSARKLSQTLMVVAVSALALTVLPAGAQGSGASTYSSGIATGTKVTREDSSLMTDLAQANIAGIEAGKLALEKSKSDQVKKFAQQMIDDHTAALKELQQLAQTKDMTLPGQTDFQHKTLDLALKVLSGKTFDNQYLKRAGVNDHQRMIELLEKAQKNSKDPDIQAFITRMLPTIQGHLQLAREMTSTAGAEKSGS